MKSLRIILLAVSAAVIYGIVHDQVTARVCVEYFTIGHPIIIPTYSPTILGLFWGIFATWWVGLPLGALLAAAARIGPEPKLEARDLVVPVVVLCSIMLAGALCSGIAGYLLAENGAISMPAPYSFRVPSDRHAVFLADLFAHNASYLVGCIGGLVLAVVVWMRRARRRSARIPTVQESGA
ncbi:MAG TPA: hypothetical protein VHI13_09785 [Candidatus Kapabacteria bacterium]|nr:hypothetical protein [Candidatus Kapabacteria bacterium]